MTKYTRAFREILDGWQPYVSFLYALITATYLRIGFPMEDYLKWWSIFKSCCCMLFYE